MGSRLFSACGFGVKNLFTTLGKTCDRLSTTIHTSYTESSLSTYIFPQTHISFTTHPHQLSPVFLSNLPLMNTTFTQFPHPLLLLQRNKI